MLMIQYQFHIFYFIIIIFLASSESKQPIHVMDYPARVSNMHSNDGQLFSVEYPVTNAAFSH